MLKPGHDIYIPTWLFAKLTGWESMAQFFVKQAYILTNPMRRANNLQGVFHLSFWSMTKPIQRLVFHLLWHEGCVEKTGK